MHGVPFLHYPGLTAIFQRHFIVVSRILTFVYNKILFSKISLNNYIHAGLNSRAV